MAQKRPGRTALLGDYGCLISYFAQLRHSNFVTAIVFWGERWVSRPMQRPSRVRRRRATCPRRNTERSVRQDRTRGAHPRTARRLATRALIAKLLAFRLHLRRFLPLLLQLLDEGQRLAQSLVLHGRSAALRSLAGARPGRGHAIQAGTGKPFPRRNPTSNSLEA